MPATGFFQSLLEVEEFPALVAFLPGETVRMI